MLKLIKARERALTQSHDLFKDLPFTRAQRTELAVAIVENADRAGEAQLDGAAGDGQGILGVFDAAAQHGIDIHLKNGVLGQQTELLIEHLEAFLGNLVRLHVIDADLKVLEAGAIQPLDALGGQKVAVGDHPGDHAVLADAPDDEVELRVQQRLPAADGDDGGAERRQAINPPVHLLNRHGRRVIVVLIAVGAGKVAAADRDDVRQNGMARGEQPFGDHPPFA